MHENTVWTDAMSVRFRMHQRLFWVRADTNDTTTRIYDIMRLSQCAGTRHVVRGAARFIPRSGCSRVWRCFLFVEKWEREKQE